MPSRVHPKELISWSLAVALGNKRCERPATGGHLLKHSRPVNRAERVRAIRENEPVANPVQLDSSGHSDPRLRHLATDLFQPRLPLKHCLCGTELLPRHADANRSTLPPQGGEAKLHEELPTPRRERVRIVGHYLPTEDRHALAVPLSSNVDVDDGLEVLAKPWPPFRGADRALQELTMSKSTSKANSFVRALRGIACFSCLGGSRQHCRRHRHRGNGNVVFGRESGYQTATHASPWRA